VACLRVASLQGTDCLACMLLYLHALVSDRVVLSRESSGAVLHAHVFDSHARETLTGMHGEDRERLRMEKPKRCLNPKP
jgi:hypothetical protein